MSWSFLELTLARACPSFHDEWTRLRRTYTPEHPPSATEFLGALRAHVVQLLAEGRVAEGARGVGSELAGAAGSIMSCRPRGASRPPPANPESAPW